MPSFTTKSPPKRRYTRQSHSRPDSSCAAVAAETSSSEFADNRPTTVAQRQLRQGVDDSPRLMAQQQGLERSSGQPVQRQGPEDEELLQGKMAPVQRQGALEEEELLQGKFDPVQRLGPEEEELLQGRFADSGSLTQRQSVGEASENQTGMPDQLKSGLEQLSGLDASGVRVHYNSDRPAQLNALAYAQGQEIHLGPGQEQHLPHEGWHAVQQLQGRVQPTTQAQGVAINDDSALEHEADVMGAKALQG